MSAHKLVLIRHGESVWNKENRFTGWVDVDLTEKGIEQARRGGQLLKDAGFDFDVAYTSVLKRAIRTLWLVLDELDQMWIPVIRSWRLNERHYGALQGLNKGETAAKYGDDQVLIWRRSFDTPPPALDTASEYYPGSDPKYAKLSAEQIPLAECLEETIDRFMPLWEKTIVPAIKAGERVLIAAHGNTLRALVMHLDGISDADIVGCNIPTGVPLVYELDESLKAVRRYYLGDQSEIEAATKAVASQGKSKSAPT